MNFKKVTVLLSEREIDLLKFIMNTEGQHTLPAAIRSCVQAYYRIQYYNKQYMSKGGVSFKDPVEENIEEEMTPDQYCEFRGGRYNKIKQTCQFTAGGSIISVPVTDKKGIDEAFKEQQAADEFNKNRKVILYE